MTERLPTADREYDRELGRITPQDREYAAELVGDIEDEINDADAQVQIAAEWIRKVRYEAVMADRKRRAALTSGKGE